MKSKINCSYVFALSFAITLGCASKNKSIGAGGLMGASVGGGIGALIPERSGSDRVRNVIIGSAIGGVAGVIMGSAAYKSQNRPSDYQRSASKFPLDTSIPPSLRKAQVERRWVEPKIAGNRYIEGHMEYIIVQPSAWEER